MKRCRLQNALICLLLVCAFSISLAVPAFAADDVKGTISLEANGKSTTLAVLLRDGVWYAEIQSLAKIAVCNSDRDSKGESVLTTKAAVSQNNGKVVFTRENTVLNYQPIILYTCDKDKNVQVDDSYYVPLEEASKALGIHFTATDGKLYSKTTRTVKDLREDLNYVFSAPNFNASSIIIDPSTHWATIETASRVYAALPFVGDGSVVGTLLGTDEDDRFMKAFTNILTFDEDMSNICVDLSNLLSDSETERDVLSTVLEEMAKMDGELEQYAETFEGINEKVDASQLKEVMSITALIEVASRFDESVVLMYKDIFQNSKNKRVKKTAQMAFDSIYPDKALKTMGENWAVGLVLGRIENRLEKVNLEAEGINKIIQYIGAKTIDSVTNGSSISNAVIYMSIYTTIQNEIREYYYKNRESMDQTDVAEKLLCAGRLYTKCIYEEYKNCSFDSEIKDSVQSADNCFRNTLKLLMSYEAKECVEEINNSNFIEYLTNDYQHLVSTAVSESEESETESVPVQYTAPFVRIYQSLLRTTYNEISDVSMYKYYVYDINGDGTPELLIGHGTCRADYTIDVYTIKNQYASYIGNVFGDELLAIEDGICGYYAQMGGEVVNVYSMNGDSITEDNFYEHDAGETYTEFSFLPSYDITDFSGLNWTVNPETGNNSEMLKKISGEY
jgi:hypothetical protein